MQRVLPLAAGLTNAKESKLSAAAGKLRGYLDAAEYKHVVLGLIFLRAGAVSEDRIDVAGTEPFHEQVTPRLVSKVSQRGKESPEA